MNRTIFYTVGSSPALRFAREALLARGIDISDRPEPDVTHLLLPVPSFSEDGRIRGGGFPEHVLGELPGNITILGGNLYHPILDGYTKLDLLQDAAYLAENAAITADCAIRIAGTQLKTVFSQCPVLVIGWGRIGKCLAAQLKAMGADVFVAARKETDRAMLRALGYRAEHPATMHRGLQRYRTIFNTVPAPVLSQEQLLLCRPDCSLIDLASSRGLESNKVIWARGLPGKDAPEASGQLIAKTVIRLIAGKECVS